MSNDKHTSTPWRIFEEKHPTKYGETTELRIGTEWIHPQLKQEAPVVTMSTTVAEDGTPLKMVYISPSNAKLIVKAVNMHEGLLSVLDQIANAPIPYNTNEMQIWIDTARKLAFKAIEKSDTE